MLHRAAIAVLLGASVLALAACGSGSESGSATRAGTGAAKAPAVADLDNVLELRALFNRDRATPRLLLILSPT